MQAEVSKSALDQAAGLAQSAFLLNGAAAAGLLTFLGNSAQNRGLYADWSGFSNALLAFAIGLLFAVGSRAGMFLSLNFFSQLKEPEVGAAPDDQRIYLLVGDRAFIFAFLTAGLILASCLAFAAGVLFGRAAIFG